MVKPLVMALICMLTILTGGNAYGQPAAAADEIQVLIDVSGSMKQNDPRNLRIDAVKLLLNLLPEGATAALWLFAEHPVLLSQTQRIDAAWKAQASKACAKIHSQGLYTDIEQAITNALQHGFGAGGEKHLILLTDGMVDTSKDIMVSADSRERILSELIPQLQQRQVKVQTIALSEQADKELLERLAFDTGGWHELAQSAEQLQRIFLKMAQQAAPKDSLPLTDNRFNVDGSVQEFSVVVFKKPEAAPTQLIAPNHGKIDRHSPNVAWLESPAYDLITVKQPQAGEWQIEAMLDPDNRVMILTDLKLQIDPLPSFIGGKQSLPLRASFTEQGKTINRADFLKLTTLSLSVDHQTPIAMTAEATATGFFNHTLAELPEGTHSLIFTGDGKTFQREIVREINVVATPISLERQIDAAKRQVTLKLRPDIAVLDHDDLIINAVIHRAGHEPETHAIEAKDGEWSYPVTDLAPGSTTVVNFNVMAKTLDGKAVTPPIAPVTIDDSTFQSVEAAHQESQAPATEHADADQQAHQQAENPSEHPSDEHVPEAEASNWLLLTGIVALANLVAAGAGIFGYKAIKKANAAKQQQLLERLA